MIPRSSMTTSASTTCFSSSSSSRPADSAYSFRRFNGDFSHEIPLYKLLPAKAAALYTPTRAPVLQYDGPDDCTGSGSNISVKRAGTPHKPRAPVSRHLHHGEARRIDHPPRLPLGVVRRPRQQSCRSTSHPPSAAPTSTALRCLPAIPTIASAVPTCCCFSGTLEHSLGKFPIGAIFSVDEGKIGLRRDDVSIDQPPHTFSAA